MQRERRPDESSNRTSDLRAELERASADLVYSSESDRPFEFFSVPFPGANPPSIDEFRALVGIDPTTRVELRGLDEFLARHTASVDPQDAQAHAIRPRYAALLALLRARLSGVQVFRVGKITIDCYVLGLDGNGKLAGLRTIAVET